MFLSKKEVLSLCRDAALILVAPIFFPVCITLSKKKKNRFLIWGHTPIINNKYWSESMRAVGHKSFTLMSSFYSSINKRDDFDLYFSDIFPKIKPEIVRSALLPWLVLIFLARNASVLHLSFDGGVFSGTVFAKLEAHFYRMCGINTIIIPYGGDMYAYSRVADPSVRNGLLLSYPAAARNEKKIASRVDYWVKNADIILMGFTLEGVGRWSIPVGNMLCIDLSDWKAKNDYSQCDGSNGVVRVLHNPNHTGIKGSEFILQAIEVLRREGLQIEVVMLKGVQNSVIKETMQSVDIHADQLILPGYGMAAIEGMASGLPVIANLDDPAYTRLFRLFSYLNECPVVSGTPENIELVLRKLVTDPELRRQLGVASRAYVEKYHSFESSQYLFGSIYKKILDGEDVDLMNLFHPLKSEYGFSKPYVKHPLVENRMSEY